MSTEQTDSKKKTIDDPVAQETLERFQMLTNSRLQAADQYVDLENEKVRLMVAIRQIDQEKQRLFEKELIDRGLTPTTPVEIDAKTGKIMLLNVNGAAKPAESMTPEAPAQAS